MPEDRIYNTGETERELKEKYNFEGSTLRMAQMRMTEMLEFLDKICRENNLTYFIAFGTLLGAVRHGGFIPWDDDLDVYINDQDMKKLRKIINEGDYPYVVQDHSIDPGFVRYYNVLRDLRSEYIKDEFEHNQRKYRGVQIDLFPYECGVLESGKRFVLRTMIVNEKYLLGKHRLLSNAVFNITRQCAIPVLKLISRLRGMEHVSLGYESVSPGYIYKYRDVFPLGRIDFEGISVACPHDPEKILVEDYGPDYNDLPGEDARNQHQVTDIRFYDRTK